MAAVLFDTDAQGAEKQAEALHQALLATMVSCSDTNDHPEPPTVSIGMVTVIPDKDTTAMELVKAADQALYQAKNEGKNRVVTGTIPEMS